MASVDCWAAHCMKTRWDHGAAQAYHEVMKGSSGVAVALDAMRRLLGERDIRTR